MDQLDFADIMKPMKYKNACCYKTGRRKTNKSLAVDITTCLHHFGMFSFYLYQGIH